MKSIGLWIVLILAVAVGAWVWIEEGRQEIEEREEIVEIAEDQEIEGDGEESEEGNEAEEAVTACVPTSATVTIQSSEDTLVHTVLVDGQAVGTLSAANYGWAESGAEIWRQTDCYAYIALAPTGLGGAIYYGGPFTMYRVNLAERTMAKIHTEDGFVMDISADEKLIATRADLDGPRGTVPAVAVFEIETGKRLGYFAAPDEDGEFDDGGSAKFSPDGTKIAFVVVERFNCAMPTPTADVCRAAVYTSVLATGETTLVETNLRPGYPVYVTGWSDNDTPIVSDTF